MRAVVFVGGLGIVGFASSMLAVSQRLLALDVGLIVGATSLVVYGAALALGAIFALRSKRRVAATSATPTGNESRQDEGCRPHVRPHHARPTGAEARIFATRPSVVH